MTNLIHFDFMVTQDDAENILACIHDRIGDCNKQILEVMCDGDGDFQESQIDWLNRRIIYLTELKLKMKNKLVVCS